MKPLMFYSMVPPLPKSQFSSCRPHELTTPPHTSSYSSLLGLVPPSQPSMYSLCEVLLTTSSAEYEDYPLT